MRLYIEENMRGVLAGVVAFTMWGGLALYWRWLERIPALDIMCYRVLFSLLALFPVLALTGGLQKILRALHHNGTMVRILCSTAFIGINWYLYIWAVNDGRVLETSLGYYINPLMNVALGCIFLRERPSRLQGAAIALACAGVLLSVVLHASFPWTALLLAMSFAAYGFIRKTVDIEALPGLFLETAILAPLALIWLLLPVARGLGLQVTPTGNEAFLLVFSGVITSIPMVLFSYAARHMRLMTLGLLQYISPTGSFLIGVYLFNEPVTAATRITFGCIWAALALYSYDGWRQLRTAQKAAHRA